MEQQANSLAPRRILLATDLTSRSDRALDRAVLLAQAWQAQLHVVHVVPDAASGTPAGVDAEWYRQRYPTPRQEALRVIARDLPVAEWNAVLHVEESNAPGAAILAVAEREGCGLIVMGESRRRLLDLQIESLIEHVMRQAQASVLAVRDRPRGMYRNLLVGTDFTDEAQQALVVSAGLFAEAEVTLLHASSTPYSYLLDGAPENALETARLREHLAGADLPEARKASIRCVVQSGPPAAMLRRQVIEGAADLTVIGAHPRGVLFDAAVGQTRRIVDVVPGDVWMVRAVRPPA